MTFEVYCKEFTAKALANGYSSDLINKCLNYAKPLFEKKLPIIYNLSHFSGLVGYKTNYITRAVYFTRYFYRHFTIAKNNGTRRQISEPLPSLKEIQIWILENILYKVPISRFAKAYIKGSTLKHNLQFHKNQSIVFTLDINDFFPSITKDDVQGIFESLGYAPLLSNLFAKLCCLEGQLPQGAPTSPFLSNMYLVDFDFAISNYCLAKKIRYTRYADDLTFSSNHLDIKEIEDLVSLELSKKHLTLNLAKRRVMTKSQRQLVTGVVVNSKLQVAREKRNRLRQELYYIKKHGLKEHLVRIGKENKNYLAHMLGKVNFILFLNPDDNEFQEYKTFLKELI